MTEPTLHGDLAQRVVVDTETMAWSPSPSGTVWRKRLHRVGPAEAGQVTSLVRYEPHSSFPAHEHPGGEEIFVLDGVFSDEDGDWPAGTYLLNPEGVAHSPRSEPGCLLFVKLRQSPGSGRQQVRRAVDELSWRPGPLPGIEQKVLYRQPGFADRTRLERWPPGLDLERRWAQGTELFVLEGSWRDDLDEYHAGCWVRLPVGFAHRISTDSGCVLLVKEGGFAYLASG